MAYAASSTLLSVLWLFLCQGAYLNACHQLKMDFSRPDEALNLLPPIFACWVFFPLILGFGLLVAAVKWLLPGPPQGSSLGRGFAFLAGRGAIASVAALVALSLMWPKTHAPLPCFFDAAMVGMGTFCWWSSTWTFEDWK